MCKNIKPNLSGNGYNFVIENLPIDSSLRVLEYRPRVKKLYRINSTDLKTLSIELLDEQGDLVKFISDVPTIVKLHVKEMSKI